MSIRKNHHALAFLLTLQNCGVQENDSPAPRNKSVGIFGVNGILDAPARILADASEIGRLCAKLATCQSRRKRI
jgi:hypothetical protein